MRESAKRKPRKLFAALAVGAGALLLAFEFRSFVGGFEQWFWIVVAALLVVLGVIQLLAPPPRDADSELLDPP